MKETNAFEKLLTSIINILFVILFYLPFHFIMPTLLLKKITIISIFLIYNLACLFFKDRRCMGMTLMKTFYKKKYNLSQLIIYSVFYTASFATFCFWIYFPFDLLLVNLLLVQLPMVLITKTTLHGFLSGKITTVKK